MTDASEQEPKPGWVYFAQAAITPAPPADCQSKHHQKPTAACPIEFLEMRPHHETRVLRLCFGCAVERAKRGDA